MTDAVPVLVVEMSQSELTSELRDRVFYWREFEKTLNAKLTHPRVRRGRVLRGGWVGNRLIPHFLVIDDEVTDNSTARLLFPS